MTVYVLIEWGEILFRRGRDREGSERPGLVSEQEHESEEPPLPSGARGVFYPMAMAVEPEWVCPLS
jgi:hypothetical protein